MFALFMPGPLELIIIGFIILVLAIVVVLVVVLTRGGKATGDNPNLKPCPDCGQSVSIHATACPKCGCPIQGK